jgi:hypothetical protein
VYTVPEKKWNNFRKNFLSNENYTEEKTAAVSKAAVAL